MPKLRIIGIFFLLSSPALAAGGDVFERSFPEPNQNSAPTAATIAELGLFGGVGAAGMISDGGEKQRDKLEAKLAELAEGNARRDLLKKSPHLAPLMAERAQLLRAGGGLPEAQQARLLELNRTLSEADKKIQARASQLLARVVEGSGNLSPELKAASRAWSSHLALRTAGALGFLALGADLGRRAFKAMISENAGLDAVITSFHVRLKTEPHAESAKPEAAPSTQMADHP